MTRTYTWIALNETFSVEGMTCGHCEATVEDALADIEGVTSASADRKSETVSGEGSADRDALVSAIEATGYEATA
jgi:copper chaperone CopZ